LLECDGRVDLDEDWRHYGHPDRLFAGDRNPYTGAILVNDTEADRYNYQYDGIWGQGQLIDKKRKRIVVGGANGKMRPIEEIIAGWNAEGTLNKKTGGQGYPQRPFYEWTRLLKAAAEGPDPVEAIKKWQADFSQTARDRENAIEAISGERADKYIADAIRAIDIETGRAVWTFHRQPFDTWQSLQFQLYSLGQANMPEFIQYQYVSEGGDADYPMGPLYSEEHDLYIAPGKDGSIQILDPKTGRVIREIRIGLLTAQGTINYGATLIGHHLYLASMNYNQYGFIYGTISHESRLDANNQPILEERDPAADGLLDIPFPTDRLYGHEGETVLIPSKRMCIFKVNILNGKIEVVNTLNRVDEVDETRYASFSTNISSVNDVVFVGGGYSSKMYGFDAKTLKLLFEYDTSVDVGGQKIFMDSLAAPMGPDLYFGAGEASFAGSGAKGKWFYCFSVC
jgi:outer membrane protein assembly factor BamB